MVMGDLAMLTACPATEGKRIVEGMEVFVEEQGV
jgi:hypothetical protein